MPIANERLETAVRNIMSGNQDCGTLANAALNGDGDYFRQMVKPVVDIYEQEAAELRRQRDSALHDAESKRFALEMVASNVSSLPSSVKAAIEKALPGRRI